jgi:magnesium transporter
LADERQRLETTATMASPLHATARAANTGARELRRLLRVSGRLIRPRRGKEHAAPGTVVHTGQRRMERVRFSLVHFDEEHYDESTPDTAPDCFPLPAPPTVAWLNVDGLHDVDALGQVGAHAGLHGLLLEDVVSVGQRPKVERYEDHLFIVIRSLHWHDDRAEVVEEQVSLVLAPHWVITFQEEAGDSFDAVRVRIRTSGSSIRTRGADFLAYALLDATVDEYFTVLEKLGDHIEALENRLIDDATPASMGEIHHLRRELLVLRKAVWPLRELFGALARDDSGLITDETKLFLRDAHDHAIQVIDTVETLRDLVAGMIELYLSTVSNRANEIMKVLTIIATVFIPLTFIVGVYGMNFDYMPELHWRWAYPALWIVMIVLVGVMLVYFRRKSWL